MTFPIRAAAAAGLAFVVMALPMTAQSSTFVFGNGPANMCARLALAGKYDTEVMNVCDKAVDEEFLSRDDFAKTLVNRGVINLRRKNLTGASRDFARAQAVMPKLPEIYINRAVVLIKQGKFADAVAMVDTGLALEPNEPEKAYFNRAIAREASGDVRGAYLDFTKALELKPDWAPAQNELVRFQVRKVG